MLKRFLALFLTLCLVFGLVPVTAVASASVVQEDDRALAESVASEVYHVNPNYNMMYYHQMKGWLDDITNRSNRVTYKVIGKSAGGRDLYEVVVTDPSALGKLGKYKALRNMMMKDPAKAQEMIKKDPDYKVPVFINNSIHGGETTGVDASVKLIEELALEDTPEVQKILQNTIVIFNLCSNPDGRVNGWRQNDNGFDCNRDMATQSQPETRAILDIITEWKPMTVIDNHGYVDPILIEPCSMPHNPNYEEDIYQKWALDVAVSMENLLKEKNWLKPGQSAEIPFRDYNTEGGWDDYPAIFIPMYAQYYALSGHTIEVGPRTYDGVMGHYYSNKAGLLFVAENREAMYYDQIEVMKRGTNYGGPNGGEFPKAYVIPAEKPLQVNPQEAAKSVNYLIRAGLEVNIATQPFTANGKSFPKGTYIVPMNQPLAGLANTLLWKGQDISVDPGLDMYDISAWNFPELWGFNREIVNSDFTVKIAALNKAALPAGKVINGQSGFFALEPDTNDAIKAVNELLNKGTEVYQVQSANGTVKAGTYIIKSAGNSDSLKSLADEYGLTFNGIKFLPQDVKKLKKLKIAAITANKGSKLSAKGSGSSSLSTIGSMAFVLRDLGYDVEVLWPSDITQKGLEGYDAVVGLEAGGYKDSRGRWVKPFAESETQIKQYFSNGGKFVGYGFGGANFASYFGLLANEAKASSYSNGVVYIDYNTSNPVTASYPANGTGFVYDPVLLSNLGADVKIDATYGKDLFMAGFWPPADREGFAGSPAIVRNDNSVIFAIDPIFRAHIKDSFRLVSNSLFYLTAK